MSTSLAFLPCVLDGLVLCSVLNLSAALPWETFASETSGECSPAGGGHVHSSCSPQHFLRKPSVFQPGFKTCQCEPLS
jgi:hypothetical protein